jgi:hypothetical protein
MPNVPQLLPCDGCGQLADSQHIAMRLQRLEWATRFRPVHIHALLLSGIAPAQNAEFLYSLDGEFRGGARHLLNAVQISENGKSAESVLTEFQKRGLMLVHVLDCPLASDLSPFEVRPLLENHLAAAVTRIRRSLKPKRVLLLSSSLQPLADKLRQTDLGCPVIPSSGSVFLSSSASSEVELQAFRAALGVSYAQTA